MSGRDKPVLPEDIRPVTQMVLDFWHSIRSENIAPHRSDLRPAAIVSILPNLMILESKGPATLNVRLAGTAVLECIGREITGANLYDFLEPYLCEKAKIMVDLLRRHPCGMLIHAHMKSRYHAQSVAEIILLPMRSRDGEISQMIGSLSSSASFEIPNFIDNRTFPAHFSPQFIDLGAGAPQARQDISRRAV